jgi:hypothetical protein
MAEKKLKRYVTVDGVTYGPDDKLPKEAADAIDNDKVYEERNDETPAQKRARELSDQALDSDGSKAGSKS